MNSILPSEKKCQEAISNIQSEIIHTPLIRYSSDKSIYLKAENQQHFGSYKIRGVANRILKISEKELEKGIVTASAGNMAQAVAYFCRKRGVPCTVLAPETIPQIKKEKILSLGAKLRLLPFNDLWKSVQTGMVELPGTFIHPAFDTDLTAGYASIAEEILQSGHKLDAVYIPFGVGGLTLGLGSYIKYKSPETKVIACEVETAAPLTHSFRSGAPAKVTRLPSFVDAIGTPECLPRVFEAVSQVVDETAVVTLEETKTAMKLLLEGPHFTVEGAAAVAFAAALKAVNPRQRSAVILTGSNIDKGLFQECVG